MFNRVENEVNEFCREMYTKDIKARKLRNEMIKKLEFNIEELRNLKGSIVKSCDDILNEHYSEDEDSLSLLDEEDLIAVKDYKSMVLGTPVAIYKKPNNHILELFLENDIIYDMMEDFRIQDDKKVIDFGYEVFDQDLSKSNSSIFYNIFTESIEEIKEIVRYYVFCHNYCFYLQEKSYEIKCIEKDKDFLIRNFPRLRRYFENKSKEND